MDVSGYDCSFRNDENKPVKLDGSYKISTDSGYDSLYHGCTSLSMEKSFSKTSFDTPGRTSSDRTPNKRSATTAIHVSTPKNSATVKRNLYSSQHTSGIAKRLKSDKDNCENDPNSINASITENDHFEHLFIIPCPESNTSNRSEVIKESSPQHQYDEICFSSFKNAVFDWKHSTIDICKESKVENVIIPERPKKSKRCSVPIAIRSRKKLEIAQSAQKQHNVRTYCNGMSYVNIICRLEPFPDILENIFSNLTNKDLLNMSLVSKSFSRIIRSNRKARSRIQYYLDVKENIKEPIHLPNASKNRQPFGQFNRLTPSNKAPIIPSADNIKFCENQNLVQQLSEHEKIVKCPRCGKGSIISNSLSERAIATFPLDTKKPPTASVDTTHVGRCTSLACKFEFCPKCLCEYHPEQKCKISQPESPSKLIVSRKKSKYKDKTVGRLNTKKQTLRRLCFS